MIHRRDDEADRGGSYGWTNDVTQGGADRTGVNDLLAELRAVDPALTDLSDLELITFIDGLVRALDEASPADALESRQPRG